MLTWTSPQRKLVHNHSCIEDTLFLPGGECSSGTGEFYPGTIEDFTPVINTLDGPKDPTSLLLLEELAHSKDGSLSLIDFQNKKPSMARSILRFIDEYWIDALYSKVPNAQYFLFFDKVLQSLVIDDPHLNILFLQDFRRQTLLADPFQK